MNYDMTEREAEHLRRLVATLPKGLLVNREVRLTSGEVQLDTFDISYFPGDENNDAGYRVVKWFRPGPDDEEQRTLGDAPTLRDVVRMIVEDRVVAPIMAPIQHHERCNPPPEFGNGRHDCAADIRANCGTCPDCGHCWLPF